MRIAALLAQTLVADAPRTTGGHTATCRWACPMLASRNVPSWSPNASPTAPAMPGRCPRERRRPRRLALDGRHPRVAGHVRGPERRRRGAACARHRVPRPDRPVPRRLASDGWLHLGRRRAPAHHRRTGGSRLPVRDAPGGAGTRGHAIATDTPRHQGQAGLAADVEASHSSTGPRSASARSGEPISSSS